MTPLYAGIGGVVRELTEMHTGINGVVTPLTEMWAGVDGVNRQIFSAGTLVGDLEVGDIIQLNEGGVPVDFYVAKHDYESGLNGSGRTLVVRKDCYDNRAWHSSSVNAWASCTMRSWLNSTYLNMLDADIRSLIGTTKYYYTPGNGSWSVTTRSDAVFLLSATELGQSQSWFNTEGSALPIASTLKIAYLNGSANTQWTRSTRTGRTSGAIYLNSSGNVNNGNCTNTFGSRPAFTLPSNFRI